MISKQQLCYLVDQGFKVEEIGTMLGVSGRTVKRRILHSPATG